MDAETFDTLDDTALAAIKARSLPRRSFANIATIDDSAPEAAEVREAVTRYFAAFLPPSGRCVCCGSSLGGILGTFTWGLAHGEGNCGRCGYPARAVHEIKDVASLRGVILQYHPDDLSVAGDEPAAEAIPW